MAALILSVFVSHRALRAYRRAASVIMSLWLFLSAGAIFLLALLGQSFGIVAAATFIALLVGLSLSGASLVRHRERPVSATRGETPGQPSLATEPPGTVLLVRGVGRASQDWLEGVTRGVERRGPVYHVGAFRYHGLRSVWALFSYTVLENLADEFAAECRKQHAEDPTGRAPCVVAHSLGSVILGRSLQRNASLVLDQVILFGSVLSRRYPWDELVGRRIRAVRNDTRMKDSWSRVVEVLAWVPFSHVCPVLDRTLFGPSGHRGFKSKAVQEEPYLGGHSSAQHAQQYEEWLDHLGLRPCTYALVPADQVAIRRPGPVSKLPLIRRRDSVDLEQAIVRWDFRGRDPRRPLADRFLLLGPPATGKSVDALQAVHALEGQGRWGYYLRLRRPLEFSIDGIVGDILGLRRPCCVVVLDDLHLNLEAAREILQRVYSRAPCPLICVCRSTVDPQGLAEIEDMAGPDRRWQRLSYDPDSDAYRGDVAKIVRETLGQRQDFSVAAVTDDVIQDFVEQFRTKLGELAWALVTWRAGPVFRKLASDGVVAWLREGEEFRMLRHGGREEAGALLLVLSAMYRFEIPVQGNFIASRDHGLGFSLASLDELANCGLVQRIGDTYELDHENTARLYLDTSPHALPLPIEVLGRRLSMLVGRHGLDAGAAQRLPFWDTLVVAYIESGFMRREDLGPTLRFRGYVAEYRDVMKAYGDLLEAASGRANDQILTRIELASACRELGLLDECAEQLESAKACSDRHGVDDFRGWIEYERGMVDFLKNDFGAAGPRFHEAAALVGRYRSSGWETYQQMYEAQSVLARFRQAVDTSMFWHHFSRSDLGGALPSDAPPLNILAELEQKILLYRGWFRDRWPSLPKGRERTDAARWEANCLLQLAWIAVEVNRIPDAERYLKQESELFARLKFDGIGRAMTVPQVSYLEGRAALLSGRWKDAYDTLERALCEYNDLKRREDRAAVLVAAGDAALQMRNFDKARDRYREAAGTDPAMCNRRGQLAAQSRFTIL